MTQEHDVLRDLIAPVALGAAAPHEIARVEAHAAQCAVCGEELAALRAAADVLAVAVPQHDPPPALKASLMATVRAEAAERAGEEPPATASAPRRREARAGRRHVFGIPAWPAAAALATIVALALAIGLVLTTSGGPANQATTIALAGTTDAPGISGKVLYVPKEDTAVVDLTDLPPLDPGDAYQLWIITDGTPVSAGLFEPTGPAAARTVATGLKGADALAVTAQPATSRDAPQGPILAQAALSG
ncbi:MAG TPA: anti-sigma factor [Miltoncostaea sp.]|nr:anti-sigma factor [Miltoncostaea sp.]